MSNLPAPPEHALAKYAVNLSFNDINDKARRHVADLIFDTVGVAIGAYAKGHASGLIAEDHAMDTYSGAGDSCLWSGRATLPADMAAFCNGTWAEILDYQDVVVDPRNNGHAGVTIVPAAMAVADREGSSGEELIAAVSAGLEVTLAVLRAVGRRHRSEGRGFRTTSIASPLGAAVACGKLLNLNHSQMLNAMGIAGACAPNGLMPSLSPANGSFGMDKDLANGIAAQLGVNAADLAKRGMTASDRVVTGELGIIASHGHGDGEMLQTPMSDAPNMGAIALKKFAACYGVHSAMEATIDLVSEHQLKPEQIDKITVGVKADSAVTLATTVVSNHMAARFSLPYAVASAVIRGLNSSEKDFEEPAIFDQDVIGFMDKIEIIADKELTDFHVKTGGFPAHIEIHTLGEKKEKTIHYPTGSMQRPMTWDDLKEKFSALTKDHFPQETLMKIMECGNSLHEIENIRDFTKLF